MSKNTDQEAVAKALAIVKSGMQPKNAIYTYESVLPEPARERIQDEARRLIDALGVVGYAAAPLDPPEAAWGGLARDIVMWMECWPENTPRTLLKHLELSGTAIPQWLRDEPEMKRLDHAISKGTKAVLIYRAMLAAVSQEAQP